MFILEERDGLPVMPDDLSHLIGPLREEMEEYKEDSCREGYRVGMYWATDGSASHAEFSAIEHALTHRRHNYWDMLPDETQERIEDDEKTGEIEFFAGCVRSEWARGFVEAAMEVWDQIKHQL